MDDVFEFDNELHRQAELEVHRLREFHRRNVKDVRVLLNTGLMFSDPVRQVLHAIEQRSMAALGAKE